MTLPWLWVGNHDTRAIRFYILTLTGAKGSKGNEYKGAGNVGSPEAL